MTFRQIEAFYWAATSASFMIAAERLHISQSTLSKRISEFEIHLGRRLFDRSGHKAVLTPAGKLLLPMARRTLNDGDELRALMADASATRGYCRVGVGESTAVTWLADLVGLVRETYPDLMLELSVDVGAVLEEQVDNGLLDFAVVSGRSSRSAVASQLIAEVPYSWAAARSLVGDNIDIDAEVLRNLTVITMPHTSGLARAFDLWRISNNFEIPHRMTCNNVAAIASLVVAGVGIGFFVESWLPHLVEHKSVVVMRCAAPMPPLRYYLQWRHDDTRPVIGRLRELVVQAVDFSRAPSLW
ncbi:MAG: LysR family transcriptional regulator [Devosia sp.]|nr:LysR family transcriptional regulator [Devosia sp.]